MMHQIKRLIEVQIGGDGIGGALPGGGAAVVEGSAAERRLALEQPR